MWEGEWCCGACVFVYVFFLSSFSFSNFFLCALWCSIQVIMWVHGVVHVVLVVFMYTDCIQKPLWLLGWNGVRQTLSLRTHCFVALPLLLRLTRHFSLTALLSQRGWSKSVASMLCTVRGPLCQISCAVLLLFLCYLYRPVTEYVCFKSLDITLQEQRYMYSLQGSWYL